MRTERPGQLAGLGAAVLFGCSAPLISTPGPKPAMNSSPIETSADTPYRIIGIDGGMITPSSALVACSEAAQVVG